jgi:hypothetical protein
MVLAIGLLRFEQSGWRPVGLCKLVLNPASHVLQRLFLLQQYDTGSQIGRSLFDHRGHAHPRMLSFMLDKPSEFNRIT